MEIRPHAHRWLAAHRDSSLAATHAHQSRERHDAHRLDHGASQHCCAQPISVRRRVSDDWRSFPDTRRRALNLEHHCHCAQTRCIVTRVQTYPISTKITTTTTTTTANRVSGSYPHIHISDAKNLPACQIRGVARHHQ